MKLAQRCTQLLAAAVLVGAVSLPGVSIDDVGQAPRERVAPSLDGTSHRHAPPVHAAPWTQVFETARW